MLQKIINETLLKKQKERKTKKRSGKWSPSGLGRCYRYQYLLRKDEPQTNPPDIRTLRIFKVGNLFHQFIQGFFPPEEREIRIETKDILGFADIVTEDSVYDIKSQHSRSFWYMEQKGYDINKEKFANVLQVMCYCYYLKKPKGILVFISKDDLSIGEYQFLLKDWKKILLDELKILRRYWKKQILPEAKPRAYGGKECKYCPYQTLCRNIEDGKETH